MTRNIFWSIGLLALVCTTCKKEPGEGGTAEIRGYVVRQDINNDTGQPQGTPYPYPETRVYIIYGDHDFYDDDVRTGPDGLYVFRWLRKGDYKVYTFGECNKDFAGCPSGEVQVLRSVSVGSNGEVVDVPTMVADNW